MTTATRLAARACDRCRRRKAKVSHPCDGGSPLSTCTSCRRSGQRCTFDLPVARRGPKSNKTRRHTLPAPHDAAPPCTLHPGPPAITSTSTTLQFSAASPVSGPIMPLDPRTPRLSTLASSPSWDTSLVDPALSPPREQPPLSSLQRWHQLARALQLRDPSADLERTVNRCFDLFFEYLFPLIPLVHEPSLRDGLRFFVTQATGCSIGTTGPELWSSFVRGNPIGADGILDRANSLKYPELWPDATFTLITAVCAEAAFLLPQEIFPEGERIADLFLKASRSCLHGYLEVDLEYPNANSVAIRYFHSNCLHAAGKPRFSWHIFGEATRLAQVMQMHDEMSLQGLSPVEAELRRRAFWIVYIGDKSAAILNNRPITIHKFSFDTGITTAYPAGIEDVAGVSPASVEVDLPMRMSFIAGFNANLRLWQTASDLILEMRLVDSQKEAGLLTPRLLTVDERHRLGNLYVLFITSLDKLPQCLQTDTLLTQVGENTNDRRQKQYVIQWANLHVSLHCLRLVITQKLEEMGYFASDAEHPDMSLLRKTEIARDMLRVIREAPFWSLQVNGEPCVCISSPSYI
ncbi:transcription factor domain-containing protein [Aspergillus clavatus NRRL 1]|uniref:C6 transcription factor, putative n=1 Tax=Aspergillus clavatus (strain ATCC 1007 / CBS 513.65 / DSM 816 / NCTC 3887 / NRRL 1 / QM 1276 / 107) TaxID=344612 RepID=A1CNJ1_ASPCL|nr:C6 transcription factor, putative [Aspergillus clavatus NRRL 1]EAW07212.1 C6 transcription factor, putative [Aspergillus clavatus NRRL 1]